MVIGLIIFLVVFLLFLVMHKIAAFNYFLFKLIYVFNIVCLIKGKFLIYKEDDKENQCFEYSILKRHGGFLKLAPPNVPIVVKVRIYVVKAFVGSIRDNGICDPYLTLQIGDKIIEDYESRQSNTTEPIFGR